MENINWHKKHKKNLSVGQRAADKMRNIMGSWSFLFAFLFIMLCWAAINIFWLNNKGFDPYPFILLNLILSTLAGLQGIILLIASKRQDEISAALAEHDFQTNIRAEKEIREVKSLHEEAHKKLDLILQSLPKKNK